MSHALSIGAVLRRTLAIYAERAPMLLTTALLVTGVLAFDRAQPERSTAWAIAAIPINLLVLGLFVCVVVLVVADAWEGATRRDTSELLRGAWSALGGLLLVGLAAGLTITVVTSIGSMIVFAVLLGILFSSGVGAWALIALLLVPVLVLVPELFLMTIWSVVVAVAVLERPGGLRAIPWYSEKSGWPVSAS